MPPPVRKYRPYFTLSDLHDIKLALASLNHGSPIRPLETYVDGFIKEIEFGLRRAAHITKPTQTLDEKLGFDQAAKNAAHNVQSAEYRYQNDLMSPEEEREYERANGF